MQNQESVVCRFCMEYDQVANMIIPCNCKGTAKYVHYDCLAIWMETKGTDICNICLSNYNRIKYKKTVKNILDFLVQTGAWTYVFCGIFSYSFMIYGIYNGIKELNRDFKRHKISSDQAIKMIYLFLGTVMTWIFLSLAKQFWSEFKSWQEITTRIIVLEKNHQTSLNQKD